MTRRVLLVEIGTPAELPVVTPPAPRPPASWAPELPPPAVLPPASGLTATSVADGALLEWTPSPAEGARSIVEAAVDNDGAPGMWREVRRVDSGLYMLSISEGKRWARIRAELNGRMSAPTSPVLCTPISVADAIEDIGDLEQSVEDVLAEQVAIQAAIDQEIADRIAEDLRIAGEAAADAAAKANAALATAQAAVDALAAEVGEIVNAPEWDASETYAAGWLVRYDGHLYRAIVETTGDQPDTSPDEWELIGEYASLGEAVAAALTLATQTASELEAEVTRINALYARMPAGTGGLATEAMVLAEAQALATQIGAEANRIDAIVARMPGGSGMLATAASVSSEAATRADADSALGARIDVTQARLGSMEGAVNPSFERDDGWGVAGPDVEFFPYSGARSGSRVLAFRPSSTSDRSQVNEGRLDVSEGQTIRAGAWVRWGGNNQPSSSAVASIIVRGYDKDGGYISGSTTTLDSLNGSQLGTSYQLIEGSATVPANWFYAALQLRVQGYSGPSGGLIAFDDAFLEVDARGVRAVANALSLTQAEVSDHGDTIEAHTLQIDAHTAEIADKADTSYVNSVEGIATAAGAQASANQTAITGLSATVGNQSSSISELMEVSADSRVGVVLNPSFERGPVEQAQADGWGNLAPNAYVFEYANARTGARVLRIDASGTADRSVINNGRTTVTAGHQVRAGYWARIGGSGALNAGATVSMLMRGYDTDGSYVGGSAVTLASLSGNSFSSTYRQLTGLYTVPANVVSVAVQIRVQNQTAGSLMVDDVFVEPIGEDVATLRARHTVALNVNGHVSGTVSENDGETSSFSILATVFRVISGPTAGIEWQNGYLRAYALGAQVVLGSNFGSTSDLMLWCGPNVGANNCTKANGLFWVDNTGDGYFAGRVLQGVLRWFNSTDSTSSSASVTTGSNPRLGKTVSLAVRYQFGEYWQYTGGTVTPGSGSTQATIVIERRYGSGSWTTLLNRTIQGEAIAYNNLPDPPSWSVTIRDELYATDTASTTDSEYRARITSRSAQGHSPGTGGLPVSRSQYLSIEAME